MYMYMYIGFGPDEGVYWGYTMPSFIAVASPRLSPGLN